MASHNKIFLSAQWQNLVMINYEIDAKILLPWLPAYTELDSYDGKILVSLVGFLFKNTKVFGIRWPWHTNFEEVNLRFYVKHFTGAEWRRGVVFISEIVPRPAIAKAASILYHEPYIAMPMHHNFQVRDESIDVSYQWKNNNKWDSIQVTAEASLTNIKKDSAEEFILEHYWGYNKYNKTKTIEYGVEHVTWQVHQVRDWKLDCDIAALYDTSFLPFFTCEPHSVFLAKGSDVIIRKPKYLVGPPFIEK
jgi:uncharacterized protein YqjF (DUF2071 family)